MLAHHYQVQHAQGDAGIAVTCNVSHAGQSLSSPACQGDAGIAVTCHVLYVTCLVSLVKCWPITTRSSMPGQEESSCLVWCPLQLTPLSGTKCTGKNRNDH